MDEDGAMLASLDAAHKAWRDTPNDVDGPEMTFAEFLLQSRLHAIAWQLGHIYDILSVTGICDEDGGMKGTGGGAVFDRMAVALAAIAVAMNRES